MKIGDLVKSEMPFIKTKGTIIDVQKRNSPFVTASISTKKFMVKWDDGDKSGWLSENELISVS